jgi:hypothetical protein
MPGIKIINVLKDDTLAEILELFRQAPAGEVIFVLPKNGKVFKRDDHFAAFASEAAGSSKTISILTSNPELAAMARAYKFNVMSAGKAAPAKKTTTKPASPAGRLASAPLPGDDDKVDPNEDAFQSDVVVPSDERMGTESPDEIDSEDGVVEGFHVEDENGPIDIDADKDGDADEPKNKDLEYGDDAELVRASGVAQVATLAATRVTRRAPSTRSTTIPVEVKRSAPSIPPPAPATPPHAGLDYIDAVWREKVASQAPEAIGAPMRTVRSPRTPFWDHMGGRHVSRKVAAGILVASLVLLGVVLWATTGKATIALTPISHTLNVQLTVQASDVYTTVDSSFNKIPGQLFEATRTATVEEAATGQRDVASKARGKITVYNEYSSTPQTLVATTRFGTPSGLVFRTLQTVTVPGSTVKEGKPVAGSVTVDVIADKPGADYNVAAGKWIIVAFQEKNDIERMNKIYGISTAAMSGGASGPSKVVTQADYDKALAAAQQQVRDQLKDAFATQAAGMRVLDEAAPTWEAPTSTARPDDAAAAVSVTAAGSLKTVAFRQADLDKLLAEVILQKERLIIVPDQLELSFSDVVFKPDIGTLVFSVTVKGPGYEPIDVDAIRNDVKGKGSTQIKEYFAQRDGIESATVSLSPFWVRSVPTRDSRIDIDVQYSTP